MPAPALPRHRAVHLERALRDGSSWPIVVRDDAGARWLVKLRGAAQGTATLVAEIIVAELAAALDLPVPPRAIVTLAGVLPTDDPHQELADLVARSGGDNLGFAYLPDARLATTAELAALDPAIAARVLWLDGLVANADRTVANPNLMIAAGQLWLIDHGAALPFQYAWAAVTEATPRAPPAPRVAHALAAHAAQLTAVDAAAAARLSRATLEAAVALVPDSLLTPLVRPPATLARLRAAYVAFLWKRLRAPRPFVPA